MADPEYRKVGHYKSARDFAQHVRDLGLGFDVDPAILSANQNSPLAQSMDVDGLIVGNRWCIHPMEGWDGTTTGEPTAHTIRRWQHFGQSGAKLIWGGEAFAVQGDGRANPHQIGIVDNNIERAEKGTYTLFRALLDAHKMQFGRTDDLLIGLQLTHSGRFCKPTSKTQLEPRIAYHHPILDRKFGIASDDDSVLLSDDDLNRIIDNYIRAAKLAQRVGFGFVDVKHCHGYLGHELLSAHTRPGKFGGSLENRTRFAREIIQGIQVECPGLKVGVRLSAFDVPPFRSGPDGTGLVEDFSASMPYRYGFGCDPNDPMKMDLTEPIEFIRMLGRMGVRLINLSCGSPYYNPHIQRPAIFPPSDGYRPPEDPLVGVDRQIQMVRQIKQACPDAILIGTGYTYLQEFLPHVAQSVIRNNWADFIGLGRLVLSYWDLPADTLAGRAMQVKRICRTFSDCTTAPRNGLVSGCYPLDGYYKELPEAVELTIRKKESRARFLK